MIRLLAASVLVAFLHAWPDAQDIDEDALFSDTSSITDSSSIVKDTAVSPDAESTTVDLSGDITSVVEATGTRSLFKEISRSEVDPGAYIVSNLLLDVRLPFDIKAFGNLETQYLPDSMKPFFALRELFLDANIKRMVYIRTGKQVLQWGRCYFWNPTDLVNVERKQFIDKIGYREGAYGIRVHVPVGTILNFYSFIDMKDLSSVDSIAGTAKIEYLLGNTEMAVSAWGKRYRDPFVGFDLSTNIMDFNIAGEVSVSKGTNYRMPSRAMMDVIGTQGMGTLSAEQMFTTLGDSIITRACLGISRIFDLLNIEDRVTADLEFYYNQAGDNGNVFNNAKVIIVRDQMLKGPAGAQSSQGLLYSIYEPNSYSKFYVAFFTSVNQFIFYPLTLQINTIVNPNLGCAVLTTALNYQTQHNFSAGLSVNSFIGPENTEYTFMENAFLVRLTAGVGF